MRLRFSTAGESHGKGVLATLEGLPKGLLLDLSYIDRQLHRRQSGYGRGGRQRIENDRVEVLSGIYRGATMDSPLTLWVRNRDETIEELPQPTRPRPGHVDLVGCQRHGDRDIRACLERASARETAGRVAAGSVAQLLLRQIGVDVLGHVVRIGSVECDLERGAGCETREQVDAARLRVESSPFGCLQARREERFRAAIDEAARAGDTLGGVVEVVATGLPPGLGAYAQWDQRLDARLGQALLSIQAMKGVEIGLGFESARRPGSEVHDEIHRHQGALRRRTNAAGGIEAGLTTGEPLICRVAKKPIATLRRRLGSVDLESGEDSPAGFERSDVCAIAAASVIAEAMVSLVLAEAALDLFGGAALPAFVAAAETHRERAAALFPGRDGE